MAAQVVFAVASLIRFGFFRDVEHITASHQLLSLFVTVSVRVGHRGSIRTLRAFLRDAAGNQSRQIRGP